MTHLKLTPKGFIKIYKCMNCGERKCKEPMTCCSNKCHDEYIKYIEDFSK